MNRIFNEILLAGEVHNSACWSETYMEHVWERAKQLHCNAILAPIYWEQIEQEEGNYDFSLLDRMLQDAKEHGLKLVLLWFGAWKNGLSTYAPEWVKLNQGRFPRTKDATGKLSKTLSMFGSELQEVETRTLVEIMRHIREKDKQDRTVVAMQLENELGVLETDRDYSLPAEAMYAELSDKDNTDTRLSREEFFMVLHYARYVNALAKAAKQVWDIPMYTNAWQKENAGCKPGDYPSGGPIIEAIDLWKKEAPCLDFVSPDIYDFDFRRFADAYSRKDNILFIPETRRDHWAVANLYLAVGKYKAYCYAPFGLESVGENYSFITGMAHTNPSDKNVSSPQIKVYLSESYKMMQALMPYILKAYEENRIYGFCQVEGQMGEDLSVGKYRMHIKYYHPVEDGSEWMPGAGLVIELADGELLFAGYGYRAELSLANGDKTLDYLSLEKGNFDQNQEWHCDMHLNGDEQHIRMEELPTVLRARYYEF